MMTTPDNPADFAQALRRDAALAEGQMEKVTGIHQAANLFAVAMAGLTGALARRRLRDMGLSPQAALAVAEALEMLQKGVHEGYHGFAADTFSPKTCRSCAVAERLMALRGEKE